VAKRLLPVGRKEKVVTKAHFTIEVDLPEGTTEGLFRRWMLSCIKHAHNKIDPAAALYDLKIDTLRVTTVNPPGGLAVAKNRKAV
jgi:hypothetical protein